MNHWTNRETLFKGASTFDNQGIAPSTTRQNGKKTSWSAVLDWYGPFSSREKCAARAEELVTKEGQPGFGLYVAIGRLHRLSIGPRKLLYVGTNYEDRNQLSKPKPGRIYERIRSSENLDTIEAKKGQAEYWLGLQVAPRLLHTEFNDTYTTESCFIYTYDPTLNKNVQLFRPKYSFAIVNRLVKLNKLNGDKLFKRWIPDVLEFNEDKKIIRFQWRRLNRRINYFTTRSAPRHRKLRNFKRRKWLRRLNAVLEPRTERKFVYEPWYAERLTWRRPILRDPVFNRDYVLAPIIALALALISIEPQTIAESVKDLFKSEKRPGCETCQEAPEDPVIARLAQEAQQNAQQANRGYYHEQDDPIPLNDTKSNLKTVNETLEALNQTARDRNASEILEQNTLPQVFKLIADQDEQLLKKDRKLSSSAARIIQLEALLAQCGQTDSCETVKRDFECLEIETGGLSCLVDGEFVSPGRVIHDGTIPN